MNKQSVSAIQQFVRVVALGGVATLITVLGIISAGIDTELGTFIIRWNVVSAVAAVEMIAVVKVALASAVDKFLHESGIETPFDIKILDSLKK